jgi:glycosyltransferase involved in cell wall biosynthesis
LISVSHSLRELVVTNGVDPEKLLVAPNAVDRATFRPGDRREARSKIGVADDELLIVSVGHLLAVKRHTVLIDAVAELRKTLAVKLVIIGGAGHEPQYPGQLKERVQRQGLEEVVRFSGKLPPGQVADWLRAANVFALASAREGCCNAVLEALACGAPVIATSVGDNPHFVRDGVDGHLVAPDDAAALAQALRRGLSASWDARAIAARLSVGAWVDTAARVIDFMQMRVAPELTRNAA